MNQGESALRRMGTMPPPESPPHSRPILSVSGGGMEYFGFDFHISILKKGFFFVVCIAFLNYVSSN